jgi:eukaryotic-like serine/threonine-protein kinase
MEERPPAASPPNAERGRRRWRFAGSVLDERTLELTVNGVDTELERKPLEVLTYLLQHAGEVCTKDELLTGVWPGRVLSETVLTKCIGRLRDVLGDKDQEIIKTAYGFGYRFVAPVQVESSFAPEPPRFDFRPGDHPPGRPLWSLVERLGIGGHGEAWRARHEKTHEYRVFKFALDETSLGALKREITLFRVINDSLGATARVVRLLDWNLEQLPYFVEAEYVPGGNLIDWFQARGGAAAVPVSERLRMVASIAEALAAVHSVGVLHKDLKPSNVLIRPARGGAGDVLLADFGSGGVLDVNHIKNLGITRLGFTKTLAASDASTGTPMYLAPEILAGQPFTVKSDIYGLGVILYQFLAGDFHKVMSPGWERHVEDELLREDIALVAEGNPAMRLADADALARRLRTLDQRRAQATLEREALARAERSRRLLERSQARRFGLMLAFAMLVAGLAVSTTLYVKARNAQARTAVAAARSEAVVQFLGNDVFAPVSSGSEPAKDVTVLSLLTRAGNEIDSRFESQPDIASELHFVVGRSFMSLYETPAAVRHFRRAMELGERLDGEGSESALRSASELIQIDYALGNLRESMSRYEGALAAGSKRLSAVAPALLELRLTLARGEYMLGNWAESGRAFEELLADISRHGAIAPDFTGRTQFYYGQLLSDLSRSAEAQTHLRAAVELLGSSLGERHALVSESRAALGRSLGDTGRFSEATAELGKAQELAAQWAPPDTWTVVRPRFFSALLALHQDQPAAAERILAEIVGYEDEHKVAYLEAHDGEEVELDHTGPVRQALGEAYAREGKMAEAIAILRRAVAVGERADGLFHPTVISARLSLAECLLFIGSDSEAQELLASAPASALADLPPLHPIFAQRHRALGLLSGRQSAFPEARASLSAALDIYRALYGPSHWRVLRAHQELQAVSP